MRKVYLFLIVLQIAFLSAAAQTAPQTRTLLRTGHILDVKTGAEPRAQTIIITGDRITAIAPTASTPKQSEIGRASCRERVLMPV